MKETPKKILFVAGETSGDVHASLLAREIRQADPDMQLFAYGGNALAGEGVRLLVDLVSLSVMGGMEVIRKFWAIRKIFHGVLEFLDREKPDAVILVDYPGFNLRLAQECKRRGIGVVYYVSPQIWAWAPRRIKKIRSCVDLMLVIFPFEKDLYERAGVPVRYVGHPSVDRIPGLPSREAWLRSQRLNPCGKFIALLPGSRVMEVQKILPVFLETARILSKTAGGAGTTAFLLPCAGNHVKEAIESIVRSIGTDLALHVVDGQALEAALSSDLALVASGTATLETALVGTPMLIVYKVNPFTYALARMLVRIPHIGLVNVLAGKGIAPEFLQHRAQGKLVAGEAMALWKDPARVAAVKEEFEKLRRSLGAPGASKRAAAAVMEWFTAKESHAPVS